MSNSSNSPSLPSTPPPCCYPDNLGCVPLHRCGTSQTYERLEDLHRVQGDFSHQKLNTTMPALISLQAASEIMQSLT
ncbi:hypothetical protein JOM56_005741 [Amanita muscaria]